MAYTPETLKALTTGLSGSYTDEWVYDTTDAMTAVRADGYITDAARRGMKQGDRITVKTRASLPNGAVSTMTLSWVLTINANGSANLVNGVELPNTDT